MAQINRERLMVGIALLCLGAFALDRFILTPAITGWKVRAARIATLQQDLEKGQLLLDREASLQDRWREIRRRSLPANAAEAENTVLTSLGEWARAGRLNITDLKPRWITDKNQPPRLEIRLSATGGLPALARFLYELEQAPLSLRLEQFEIRARDEQGSDLALEVRLSGMLLAGEKS